MLMHPNGLGKALKDSSITEEWKRKQIEAVFVENNQELEGIQSLREIFRNCSFVELQEKAALLILQHLYRRLSDLKLVSDFSPAVTEKVKSLQKTAELTSSTRRKVVRDAVRKLREKQLISESEQVALGKIIVDYEFSSAAYLWLVVIQTKDEQLKNKAALLWIQRTNEILKKRAEFVQFHCNKEVFEALTRKVMQLDSQQKRRSERKADSFMSNEEYRNAVGPS